MSINTSSTALKQIVEDKMSPENFRVIFEVLFKLANNGASIPSSSQNDIKLIIETIIEYLIADKDNNDSKYFQIFIEMNMIKDIINLTAQNNRIINIAIFKGFSLLLTNISNKDQLLYLFSNNYINRLLCLPYDNSDADFVYYYINFIKSLAMKIDSNTIHYFFNQKFFSFPLLINSLKLYNYPDQMISNVVRTILLSIFKLNYPPVEEFLFSLPCISYYIFIVCRFRDTIKALQRKIYRKKMSEIHLLNDDILNDILFFQDIFSLKNKKMNFALTNIIFHFLILPVIVPSITSEEKNKSPISKEVSFFIINLLVRYIKDESFINSLIGLLFFEKISTKMVNKIKEGAKDLPNYESDLGAKELTVRFVEFVKYNFSERFVKALILQVNNPLPEIQQLITRVQKIQNFDLNGEDSYKILLEELGRIFSYWETGSIREYHSIISKSTGIQCGLSNRDDRKCFLHIFKKYLKMEKKEHQSKFQDNYIRNEIMKVLKFAPTFEENPRREIQIYLLGILFNQIFNNKLISEKLLSLTKLSTAKELLNLQHFADLMEDANAVVVPAKKSKVKIDTIYFKNLYSYIKDPKFKLTEYFEMTNSIMSSSFKTIQNKLNEELFRTFLSSIFSEPLLNKRTNVLYLEILKKLICFKPEGETENKVVRIERAEQKFFLVIYQKYLTDLYLLIVNDATIKVNSYQLMLKEKDSIEENLDVLTESFFKNLDTEFFNEVIPKANEKVNVNDNDDGEVEQIDVYKEEIKEEFLKFQNLMGTFFVLDKVLSIIFNEKETCLEQITNFGKPLEISCLNCGIKFEGENDFLEGQLKIERNLLQLIRKEKVEKELYLSGISIQIDEKQPKLGTLIFCNYKGFLEKISINAIEIEVFAKFLLSLDEKVEFFKQEEFKIVNTFFEKTKEKKNAHS